jgi:hypothetical protein
VSAGLAHLTMAVTVKKTRSAGERSAFDCEACRNLHIASVINSTINEVPACICSILLTFPI